jgi:putative transposase
VARRDHQPEEIIAKLREAEILLAQAMKAPEVVKKLGIHEGTYYRWGHVGGLRRGKRVCRWPSARRPK